MGPERLAEDLLTLARKLRPLRHHGMTPQQYWLLRHLRRSGPRSIGELADELGVTTGSATMACKRLEKDGLVVRERQADDERKVQVALTDQGRAQIDTWLQHRLDALTALLDVLDQQEQQELQRLLERLIEAAEEQGFKA
ncbi:MAG: MarR family transcriptional regulator [Chloroflexi bacterium]|nr:MarR family transcriptional regulator [Chloroflexota bacterium]